MWKWQFRFITKMTNRLLISLIFDKMHLLLRWRDHLTWPIREFFSWFMTFPFIVNLCKRQMIIASANSFMIILKKWFSVFKTINLWLQCSFKCYKNSIQKSKFVLIIFLSRKWPTWMLKQPLCQLLGTHKSLMRVRLSFDI